MKNLINGESISTLAKNILEELDCFLGQIIRKMIVPSLRIPCFLVFYFKRKTSDQHFIENNSQSPDICRSSLIHDTFMQFWRHVIGCSTSICYFFLRILLHSKSKIDELHFDYFIRLTKLNHNIFCLEIPMENIHIMKILDSEQNLFEQFLSHILTDSTTLLRTQKFP